ncbi:epimerase [Actinoplanes italicus]|uniref:Putative NAD(P)-binding protein n=1 Tax=Actinoplanes italicus TaxID=113567 RepID=A0A2T0KFN8_9ACTN|nr:NAD(P)H-binding protein [Actinoplanes italicus]PRX21978.1 putative NAD(P)-binding protein [Actinoplanes italicus]GIE29604.1 epimerase [Actinoplanes italicus]
MQVVLFGATGMVGHGVLTALLEDPAIAGVTAVSRRRSGRSHPKLHEVIHTDFADYRHLASVFASAQATICLGTPSTGKSEAEYTRITRDYAVAAATAGPGGLFVYVSANRADSTSRTMWIRVKGRAEEALSAVHPRVFLVRPGLIRPCRGARPATRAQRIVYAVLTPFHPLLKRLFPRQVTTTDAIGQAVLRILHAPQTVPRALDNTLINQLGESDSARRSARC